MQLQQVQLDGFVELLSSYANLETFMDSSVLHAEDDQAGLVLSTVHSAKGLEFHTVFLAGLYQHPYLAGHEEEDRCIFYVGATRAARELYLTAPIKAQIRGQVEYVVLSPYLRSIPASLYRIL
jgi:DNA helicase II / ATP-dependent DNA helicase PcrA